KYPPRPLATIHGLDSRSAETTTTGYRTPRRKQSPAADPARRYPVTPVGSNPPQDHWVLDQMRSLDPGNGNPRPRPADVMVLDAPGGGYADFAWMPDSGSVCVASIYPTAKDPAPSSTVMCTAVPAMARGGGQNMFGPRNVGGDDQRGLDWFAIVAGSNGPLTLKDGIPGHLGPLHQRTAKAANGVVYTIAEYYFGGGPVFPGPVVGFSEPQLCTASGSLCRNALGTYTYPGP
ncbi:hypothetical protein ABIA33_006711, partial [Streptacidiphilus sp. MAP12-16]|uniref:hypothetical protein n=1 Tax=Streptacidiphilus sp. MAP12-16 TaxID=3156300 RepID=UPI00351828BC